MSGTPDDLLALADGGVKRAKAAGATEVEVFLWRAKVTGVEHSGRGAHAQESDQSGVGVRLAIGQRVASSTSSGYAPSDVAWAVDQALSSARLVPARPTFKQLADPKQVTAPPTALDPRVAEPDVERLLADVDAAAAAARASPAVSYFNAAQRAHNTLFVVANGRGVATWDVNAYESMHLEVRARGAAADKYAAEFLADRRPLSAINDLGALAAGAAARAEDAAAPKPLPGFVRDVIFDATTAVMLLGHFTTAMSGGAARKGRSRLAGKLGEQVVAESITLRDEPHGPDGCRNQRVDDEGVPTRPATLVEKGVLKTYLYDSAAAHQEGLESTGNGYRPIDLRYAGGVSVKPGNLVMAPGDWTLDEMVRDSERAVLVRDFLMGTFTMNDLTGDFSFVAPLAYLVEGGKVRHALVSTTVAGNLFDALRNVTALGKEQRCYRSARSVPLRVTGLTCAT